MTRLTSRRSFLTGASALVAAPALLRPGRAMGAEGAIKVGLVTPMTGPLAFFSEPDGFVLNRFAAALSEGAGGRPIEILVKDSQSSASRAAEVAAGLILEDEVALVLSAGGPDTVNPVADQAELNGVPSLSTSCPWQPFVMGRGSAPDKGFQSTYLFAFGLEDVIAAYLKLWQGVETNRKVGVLFPNDADGNAWGDAQFGFPPALTAAGYEVVDPGRFEPMSNDFSAQIGAFKAAGVEIVMGTMIPPDFITFWTQSAQQGLTPRIATIGKSLLLPNVLAGVGERASGLTTELAWHPAYPFTSTTTGESAKAIAEAWTTATGKPWIQTIGLKHALIDLCVQSLRGAADTTDPAAILVAIQALDVETTLGRCNFAASKIRNVAKATILGGQWWQEGAGFSLEIAANPTDTDIPLTRPVMALGGQ
jgi:branched-chain amino acid transport system substrate-binding protein